MAWTQVFGVGLWLTTVYHVRNLSRNAIWALETNSELDPYPALVQLCVNVVFRM